LERDLRIWSFVSRSVRKKGASAVVAVATVPEAAVEIAAAMAAAAEVVVIVGWTVGLVEG
jgi:hypothetical protein